MQLETLAVFVLIYLLLNVVVFCTYWWDKQAAIEGAWRVRESTLLMLALVGGSFGAITARRVPRHKTRKEPFRTILAIIASLHVALVTLLAGIWFFTPEGTVAAVGAIPSSYQ